MLWAGNSSFYPLWFWLFWFHIEGLYHVDASLNDIVEDTDEERRPILKLEENLEKKITNNGSHVYVPAKVSKISAKTIFWR